MSLRNYVAVVPARKGSKGIINKNILDFCGMPLLVHSLLHAASSKLLASYFLWTDSKDYFNLANKFCDLQDVGFRVDHVNDLATDEMFLNDFIGRFSEKYCYVPDAIVLLRPTSPLRSTDLIDHCIQKFDENWDFFDSLRTVSICTKTPYKMWFDLPGPNKTLLGEPLSHFLGGLKDAHSMPRQLLRKVYAQNGVLDIIKVSTLRDLRSSAGNRVMLYDSGPDQLDIDSIDDIKVLNIP
jgi:N-acylneuraminate cytidylyltransferase